MTPYATTTLLAPIQRFQDRPVVEAGSVAGYGPIFNAGLLHHDGRYHLFARAVRDHYRRGGPGEPRFVDYVSDIVVFTSLDGIRYEFAYVLSSPSDGSGACFEDPRVQRVTSRGVDHLVMTYTNLPRAGSREPWRIGAQRLVWTGARFHLEAGTQTLLGPDAVENKDAVVFNLSDGRVAMIHRIHPDMQLAVFDDLEHLWSANRRYWRRHLAQLDGHTLISSNDALGVGAGAPPVVTDDGLLLFFHRRDANGVYTMNLALLDHLTGRVKRLLDEPVLRPELDWERRGDVDQVIFVQGAHADGDDVYLTYGAADRCVGAAVGSISHLLALLDSAAPALV